LPRRGPTWKVVLIALMTSMVIGAVSGYAYKHSLTRGALSMPRTGAAVGARIVGWPRSHQLHSCGRMHDPGRRQGLCGQGSLLGPAGFQTGELRPKSASLKPSDAPLPNIATAHEA
jgi:hypothetical protein